MWTPPEIQLTVSLAAFLIASLFDFAITLKAINLGMTEANPIIRILFNTMGAFGVLAWKITLFLLLTALALTSQLNANVIWFGVTLYLSANILMLFDIRRTVKAANLKNTNN